MRVGGVSTGFTSPLGWAAHHSPYRGRGGAGRGGRSASRSRTAPVPMYVAARTARARTRRAGCTHFFGAFIFTDDAVALSEGSSLGVGQTVLQRRRRLRRRCWYLAFTTATNASSGGPAAWCSPLAERARLLLAVPQRQINGESEIVVVTPPCRVGVRRGQVVPRTLVALSDRTV